MSHPNLECIVLMTLCIPFHFLASLNTRVIRNVRRTWKYERNHNRNNEIVHFAKNGVCIPGARVYRYAIQKGGVGARNLWDCCNHDQIQYWHQLHKPHFACDNQKGNEIFFVTFQTRNKPLAYLFNSPQWQNQRYLSLLWSIWCHVLSAPIQPAGQ